MITDLKDFEKFLKICRKQGVTDVTLAGVSVKLRELTSNVEDSSSDEIPTDAPTADELIYYAVNGGAQ